MYNSKDFTPLRSWTLDRDANVTMQLLKDSFEEIIVAAGYKIAVVDIEIDESLPAISIQNREDYRHMGVYVYCYENTVEMAIEGKGHQVKATDLEKVYSKAVGAIRGLQAGYTNTKNIMGRFGMNKGASIGVGVGVAAGAVIGGSIRAAVKLGKLLLRDKEAYEKEMAFYELAIGIGDYIVGGTDPVGVIRALTRNAEENNDKIAQYLLGNAYCEGRGVGVSLDKSIRYYALAAKNGEQRSREILAIEYLYGESDYTVEEKNTGLIYLTELADNGDIAAANSLIDVYRTGEINGIPANASKTIEVAENYAREGNVYACAVLANIYDSAKKSEAIDFDAYKDDEKAFKYYVQLIQHDEPIYIEEAAMSLARMYRDSRGVDGSREEELKYYGLAASKGNLEAKCALANAYTLGLGTDKDHSIAQKICNELIKSGNKEVLPTAYYCSYVIADEAKKYKVSMENARKYISCINAEEEKAVELQKYLVEQEALLSKMTDAERREYLQERKPLFNGFTGNLNVNKKTLAIIVGLILLLIIGFFGIKSILCSEADYSSEGRTVATTSSNYAVETECQETDIFTNDDTEILVRTEVDMPTITGNEMLNSGVQDWANNYVELAESFRSEYSDFSYDYLEYTEPYTDSEFYGTDYPIYFYSRHVVYIPEDDGFLKKPRADDKVLSLIYNSYSETGGAHGFSSFDGASFDVETGELLSFEAIATDYDSFSNKVLTIIINEIEVKAQEIYIFEDYEDTIYSLWYDDATTWYMSDTGLVFIYSPYTLATYADGSIVVEVPYEDVADYMEDKYLKQ